MSLADFALDACNDDAEAHALVGARVWPNGPVCPHCRVVGGHYRLSGKSTRLGLHKCRKCRGQFTVTVGTPFHKSHVPLAKLCRAVALVMNGTNAAEMGRVLGITHISAWKLRKKISRALRA